jgi:hypothetical protein
MLGWTKIREHALGIAAAIVTAALLGAAGVVLQAARTVLDHEKRIEATERHVEQGEKAIVEFQEVKTEVSALSVKIEDEHKTTRSALYLVLLDLNKILRAQGLQPSIPDPKPPSHWDLQSGLWQPTVPVRIPERFQELHDPKEPG